MNDGQLDISAIILVGVIAFVGALLLGLGMVMENWKNQRILQKWGIIFLMGAGVGLFVMSAELRGVITAFATVVAVVIAGYSINESRRIRQDSIEREGRDRKERLIDEAAKWLGELESRIFPKHAAITSEVLKEADRQRQTMDVSPATWRLLDDSDRVLGEMYALAEGIKETEYYRKLTLQLDEELSSLIEAIGNNLEQRRQLHVDNVEHARDHDEEDKDESRFARNAGAIRESILNAIDKAIEVRVGLVRVS